MPLDSRIESKKQEITSRKKHFEYIFFFFHKQTSSSFRNECNIPKLYGSFGWTLSVALVEHNVIVCKPDF